jgi:hypothetical protein
MTRTVSRYVEVHLDDSGGTLRELAVNTIGDLGLDYAEVDLTAFLDAIHGVLLDTPTFSTTIGGPFDSTTHGYLAGVAGKNTPLSFDVRVGMGRDWQAGDPQFGITSDSSNGVLLKNYRVNLGSMTWSADVVMYAGSSAPAWGTAAEA